MPVRSRYCNAFWKTEEDRTELKDRDSRALRTNGQLRWAEVMLREGNRYWTTTGETGLVSILIRPGISRASTSRSRAASSSSISPRTLIQGPSPSCTTQGDWIDFLPLYIYVQENPISGTFSAYL